MKQAQTEDYIALCKEQYKLELDIHLKYHQFLYDTLNTQTMAFHDSQMQELDDIHDHEVGELKKKLDGQSREEMKALAKKHKDKNELSRFIHSLSDF